MLNFTEQAKHNADITLEEMIASLAAKQSASVTEPAQKSYITAEATRRINGKSEPGEIVAEEEAAATYAGRHVLSR